VVDVTCDIAACRCVDDSAIIQRKHVAAKPTLRIVLLSPAMQSKAKAKVA
jgi:hypothetical protein